MDVLEIFVIWYYLTPLIRLLKSGGQTGAAHAAIKVRISIVKKIASSLINLLVRVRVENLHREVSQRSHFGARGIAAVCR